MSPILVTELGISIDVKAVADWKALSPILVTELGISIDVKAVAAWNALSPILVTYGPTNTCDIFDLLISVS